MQHQLHYKSRQTIRILRNGPASIGYTFASPSRSHRRAAAAIFVATGRIIYKSCSTYITSASTFDRAVSISRVESVPAVFTPTAFSLRSPDISIKVERNLCVDVDDNGRCQGAAGFASDDVFRSSTGEDVPRSIFAVRSKNNETYARQNHKIIINVDISARHFPEPTSLKSVIAKCLVLNLDHVR
jgi:hypothetical protein